MEQSKKASYNWLRAMCEKGFQELMSMMPEGEEETLEVEYEFRGEIHSLLEERNPVKLLEDFTKAVDSLRRIRGSSPEEVRTILSDGGVAQAVLMEEEWWVQKYLD